MNSKEKPGTVVTGDLPAKVRDEGDGVSKDVGVEEPDAVSSVGVPADAKETLENGKESSVGRHERNGSMCGAFLAAPGYSPSFASLGDTNSFESHHAPRYSDTFEGFEPPRLSHTQEVQETPKVTRPEGLSFITPVVNKKNTEILETPQDSHAVGDGSSGFSTPFKIEGEEGEKQTAEDYTSPIANLVENPPPDAPLPSPSTPTELIPALGNVGSFSFSGTPEMSETPKEPQVISKNTAGDVVLPSPSTPTELVPALGNVDSFSFGGVDETSQTTNEPHVVLKKIPGHELLNSFMATKKPANSQIEGNLHGVNAVSSPVIEASSPASNYSDMPLGHETFKETQPDAAETVQPKIHESPLSEDPAVSIAPSEKLDGHATDSPLVHSADAPTIQKSVDTSNVATGSQGVVEEVVEKSAEHGLDTAGEKEVGNALPQTQIARSPETFAFRNVEAEKEVSTSATTETSKLGPLLGNLKSMSTKKWRGPRDDDLKKMVVIPEYLSRDMANAVATEGTANPEGPPAGEKVEAPTCPIVVFINSRSGGRLGPELMDHFKDLITPYQVYDLSEHSPSAVLRYGIGCLDRMAEAGDECARQTRKNLRILVRLTSTPTCALVAGGDGTVGWCLSSVGALRGLSTTNIVPPVGVIPLGTGNDLSRSFGWGGSFSSTNKATLKRCLVKALDSNITPLDTWKVVVMPAKSVAADSIHFPHAMHPQHHVPLPSSVAGEKHDKDETAPAFEGLFFNYLSVGMDAQVAYGFHHLRDEKPWLARGRTANQMIYSGFGCTQGWFCTACSMAPRARGVSNILKLSVRKRGSTSKDWEEIHLPSNIRAVVICNLQSYAGGRNPWGKPSSARRQKEGLEEQKPDDGLLEIMGLKDGWHSAFVLLEVSTAVRLCQAEAVKLELSGNARTKSYLQMDGEPWMQPMGEPRDEPTVVTVEKLPSPSMLLKR